MIRRITAARQKYWQPVSGTAASGIHRFRGARLKAAQDVLQRRFIHQTLIVQDRSLPCYAGKLNLVLTESGQVYPCEILPQSLGNVREHDYDIMQVTRTE